MSFSMRCVSVPTKYYISLCIFRMLFFIVVSFLNVMLLSVMLGTEIKRLGCHLTTFYDKKVLIFIIILFMQLRKFL